MIDPHTLKSAKPLAERDFVTRMAERGTETLRADDGSYWMRKAGYGTASEQVNGDTLKALCEKRGVKWDERYKDRVVRHWASDERVDGHGDIVMSKWDFGVFAKNAPMPLSHNWAGLQAGYVLDWSLERRSEPDYEGPALRTLGIIVPKDMNPIADEINNLIQGGIMRGCSVGFRPLEVIDVEDDKERRQLGLGRYGLVFAHNQLLELSPTMIPANPGAHTMPTFRSAKDAGFLTVESMCVLRELRRQEALTKKDAEQAFTASEMALFHVARALWPEKAWHPHKDITAPVEMQVPLRVEDKAEPDARALADLTSEVAELRSAVAEMAGLMQEVHDVTVGATEDETNTEDDAETEATPMTEALSKAITNVQSARRSA